MKSGKTLLFLIFLVISATVFFRVSIESTNYCSPDSDFYLRVAENILNGKGLVAPHFLDHPFTEESNEEFFGVWPLGYPIMIAAFSKLTSLDVLWASKVINLLFFGSIFILLYKWFGERAWFPSLYFFSYGKLEVFSYTWSECPFLFFMFLLFYLLYQIEQRKEVKFLFFKVFLVLSVLFLLRYAGIIYYFFIGLFMVYYLLKGRKKITYHLFFGLLLSSILAVAYLYNNYVQTGYYTGMDRVQPEVFSFLYVMKTSFQGLVNEVFLARNYFYQGIDYLFFGFAGIQLVIMIILFLKRKLMMKPVWGSKTKLLIISGVFYLVFVTVLIKIQAFDTFDYRILSPVSTPIFIAIFATFSAIDNNLFFRETKKWVVGFMVFCLVMNLPKEYLLELIK